MLKDGKDITIIAIGDLVYEAVEAAKDLESRGISAAVIDMASVKPIDRELVCTYAETVSYTHLDVYKRQVQERSRWQREQKNP